MNIVDIKNNIAVTKKNIVDIKNNMVDIKNNMVDIKKDTGDIKTLNHHVFIRSIKGIQDAFSGAERLSDVIK
ncbi:hypothetical protein M8J77_014666 [Diaphorina citri]|nr:hypothetical protein M8J77_014666 [Diaphorina citri]